jgi:4-hydroxyphenylpyruvate dioxygenase
VSGAMGRRLQSFWETTKRGAKPYQKPTKKRTNGEVIRSGIYTYGETVHMFVERKTTMVHVPSWFQEMGILQPRTSRFKIYRSHGRQCRMGMKWIPGVNLWRSWDLLKIICLQTMTFTTEYTALMR